MNEEPGAPSGRPRMNRAQLWTHYQRYPYLLAKLGFFGVLLYGVYAVINGVESVAFPLFMSLLISWLLDPFVDKMEERGINRTVGILIILSGLMLFLVGFIAILYPMIANQVRLIAERLPDLVRLVQEQLIPWVQDRIGYQIPTQISEAIDSYGEEIRGAAPTMLQQAGAWLGRVATQTGILVTSLLNLVMIPIFTFYFLRDFDIMRMTASRYIPSWRREHIVGRLREIDDVVGAWFRGQMNVALILSVLYAGGLVGVFVATGHDWDAGLAIGILSGLLNIIPYFGFIIGFSLSLLVTLIDWHGAGGLIGVIVVFAVVQSLEGYVITPRIVGEKVGLSPVTVIVVLLLGGELAGLLGVLLAIPVAGAIKVVLPDLMNIYMRSSYFTGETVEPPSPTERAIREESDIARHPADILREQITAVEEEEEEDQAAAAAAAAAAPDPTLSVDLQPPRTFRFRPTEPLDAPRGEDAPQEAPEEAAIVAQAPAEDASAADGEASGEEADGPSQGAAVGGAQPDEEASEADPEPEAGDPKP